MRIDKFIIVVDLNRALSVTDKTSRQKNSKEFVSLKFPIA